MNTNATGQPRRATFQKIGILLFDLEARPTILIFFCGPRFSVFIFSCPSCGQKVGFWVHFQQKSTTRGPPCVLGGFRLFLAKPAHVLISRMNGEIEKPNIVFDKEFEEYYEMFWGVWSIEPKSCGVLDKTQLTVKVMPSLIQ